MSPALKLAVVGHTNTGKTSLLRTLTRDTSFGEVSARPSATRHVEGARLILEDAAVIELFDTPGLEDAMSLLDFVHTQSTPDERLDGPARIARFLASKESRTQFEQESKVLRQLLASDAGLVVIDVRDPVLAKYRDELSILTACGKPLLPVLNFVRSANNNESTWREALARLGLHSVISFDTVTPEIDGEQQLFAKLALMLDAHAPTLQRLIQARQNETQERLQAASQLIATMLLDIAAYRVSVPNADAEDDAKRLHTATEHMREQVRQHEAACVRALLKLYRFRTDDVQLSGLPILDGRWESDLFSREALSQMGIHLSRGLAAGAVAGISVDLVLGGLTLGAATLAGALTGGLWQLGHMYGERVIGALRGYRTLTVDDSILRLLALRQTWLLRTLQQRGHAAMHTILLDTPEAKSWREGALPDTLKAARSHEEWSAMRHDFTTSEARDATISTLASVIHATLPTGWMS